MALDAGLDVELPGTDCYGEPLLKAVRSGESPRRPSTPPCAGCSTTKFELGLFEQPIVEPRRRRRRDRHPGPSPARRRDRPQVARAAAQRRHPAAASDVGFDRRDRPQRRRGLAISSGTTPTPSMSSRCRRCCAAVATCSTSRSTTSSTPSTPRPRAPSVARRTPHQIRRPARFARGLRRQQLERTGFAEAVAAGRRVRRRRDGDGRQGRAHRRLHER